MPARKLAGRPINAEASTALKSAALRLVRENGYEKVSIAAIVKEAGVARQTLYNRWNTKADLVLEAVFEETNNYAAEPLWEEGKDCRTSLEEFLVKIFEHLNTDGDTLRALIASAQHDSAFQSSFYTNFVLPREKMITVFLLRAQERGELPQSRNAEMLSTLIHGAFWYWLLNSRALDVGFARDLLSELFI